MITVAAGQLGPIARDDDRATVVDRLITLLREACDRGADLVAFPELALTTFFPRWYVDDLSAADHWYETEMPGPETEALFGEAARLGMAFSLGFAERTPDGHRYNTQILVGPDGVEAGRFRKVHIPGHAHHEPDRPFQHLERYYFEPGPDPFEVWPMVGARVGLATCNDRRWSETYRLLALAGADIVLIGYNTPLHYAPDPSQDTLAGFHNHLVMQAGAYQNGLFVVGVAKGGTEEGVASLAESAIIAPSGELLAVAQTTGDEVIVADCDLEWCRRYRTTVFDFERYRRPELYGPISRTTDRSRP